MFNGSKINVTEKRSVLHVATRMDKDQSLMVDGEDVVKQVWEVRERIHKFSDQVRNGEFKGFTGKDIMNVIVIGIGGSYLGPEFVYESLRFADKCEEASKGRSLRFLANVDPVDFSRSMHGLDIEETLFIINSKTLTTAETMLNARTAAKTIFNYYKKSNPNVDKSEVIKHHVVAGSTNIESTKEFGIDENNVFGFWDWVGGRYSVCSAIGILPLALHYGYDTVCDFLSGAKSMDDHFKNTKGNHTNS
jgi:glucose-6-phosphate isomerase